MGTGTEEYYQARAAEYDLVYDKPERQADLRWLRRSLADQLAGRRVLEIAAGTGYWTDVFADRAASVLATDVSPAPLEIARARRSWPATVRFAEADAFGRTGIAGRFDAAFAGFFWSHVPVDRLTDFVAGLADLMGSSGTVIFADNRFVEGSNHPVTRTDEQGNTYQQRTLTDGTSWEVLKNFPSSAELRTCLAPVSRNTRITELDYYWLAVCELDGQEYRWASSI